MISAPRQAVVVDGAPTGTSSTASAEAAAPFDSVLAVESLAATCVATALPTALDGVAAEMLAQSDLDAADDSEEPGVEDADLDALGYLSALLMGSVVPRVDVPPGKAEQGESPMLPGTADEALREGGAGTSTLSATSSSSSLLATIAERVPGAALPQAGDLATVFTTESSPLLTADTTTDPGTPARATEWLAQATRHAESSERHEIATSMRHPRWAEEFATRMTSLVRAGESRASLQLSPVELGPMDVSVTVRDSQASIHFAAAHADTRALIEASLPRLRDMLAAQGFNLLDASVSQGFDRPSRSAAPVVPGAQQPEAEAEVQAASSVRVHGLLDLYV